MTFNPAMADKIVTTSPFADIWSTSNNVYMFSFFHISSYVKASSWKE